MFCLFVEFSVICDDAMGGNSSEDNSIVVCWFVLKGRSMHKSGFV